MPADAATRSSRALSPKIAHRLCIATLILVGLLLRLPSLDRVALNPDEGQFEATASYLVSTGRSAFELPYLIQSTLTVYKWLALLFGPYPTVALRLLIAILSTLLALLLFRLVRREVGLASGLLCGLIFLHLNIHFEGLSANREWFALSALGLSVLLALEAPAPPSRRRQARLFLSGALAALSLTFKLQMGPLLVALPAWFLLQAPPPRRLRAAGRDLVPFAAGAVGGGLLYLLPFLFFGTLSTYLLQVRTFLFGYTLGGAGRSSASLLRALLIDLPYRPLFLAAYVLAMGALAARLLRFRRASPPGPAPLLVLSALALLGSLVSVQLGGRFFPHYFLLLLPWVCLLVSAAALPLRPGGPWPGTVGKHLPPLLAAALALDGLLTLVQRPWRRWLELWPASSIVIGGCLVFLAILVFWLLSPKRRSALAVSGWILLQAALLVVQTQGLLSPRSLPHHPGGFSRLTSEIQGLRAGGDRLFVWGWLPELYSLTRLEASSHLSICQYVVGDYLAHPGAPALHEPFATMLMQDLRSRPPRFIVDASARSWTMVAHDDPRLYRLESYPDLGLLDLLRRKYRLLGRFDGCDLWVRR